MDTVTLIGRLLVSLAAVLGVVWLIGRRMRKTGRGRSSGLIEVLDRRQLSRNSSVAVVRVGEQALVIGVTDNQVSVLGETDAEQAISLSEAARPVRSAKSATKSASRSAIKAASTRPATSRHRSAAAPRPAARAATVRTAAPIEADVTDAAVDADDADDATPSKTSPATTRSPLAGSALSPQTWKQTIESLREMTAR